MARENKTQYALLGYLHYKPQTGYDLKQNIDNSIRFFWNENYGHIYPVLKKLKEKGYVTMKEEQNPGKPARKIYSITDAGRACFKEWMERPPEPEKIRKEILLKVFFSGLMESSKLKDYILAEKRTQEELIKTYTQILEHLETHSEISEEHKTFWKLTVECGFETAGAEIRWCDSALEMLQKKWG